jgi:uncharacterized protein
MSVAAPERSMAFVGRADASSLRRSGLEWATVICGAALAVLTATDGTPAWQGARVLLVAAVTAAAVIVEVMSSPRWRGRVAVVAGVPALAVAIGFSPYLAKGGPVLVRAATLLLAVAAVVLTAGGTVAATRGHLLLRRLATGVAVGVVTALVVFVTSPAVAATNVPRADVHATPADVGLAYEDVRLQTDDGVTLAGWYLASANRAAVVLLHGAGSTRWTSSPTPPC